MKNNIDYIYKYSNLNPMQTSVQILTGEYKDIIVEFGSSDLNQYFDENGRSYLTY